MTSTVRCRLVLSVVAAVILWPPALTAQGPGVPVTPATPGAEHFAVGAVCSVVPGAIPWGIAQARIEAPLTRRWFINGDVGGAFGTARIDTGQVPTGVVMDVHAKWMYAARGTNRRAGYLFFGPRVIAAKNIDQRGQVTDRRSITLLDIGWGLDWRIAGGWHVGVEIGGGAGKSPLLFINGFVLLGPG